MTVEIVRTWHGWSARVGRDGDVEEEQGPSMLGVNGRASALKGRAGDPVKLASRG